MQTLLRHIHKDRAGREALDERVLDEAVITVGHASDQSIQLRDPAVARRHVELRPTSKGRFRYRFVGGADTVAGGRSRRRGVLQAGDRIELGDQVITVGEPEPGFDAVLELATVEPRQGAGAATHHRIELAQTGLAMRRPAWIGLIAVLLLFLAIPLAGYFWPEMGRELRENPLLPSDHVWSTGPLAGVHHTPEIGLDCQACHQQLLKRAPDGGCLDCHAEVTGHVDRSVVAVPTLDATRCATCHREHLEPSRLVRNEEALCVDCHEAPEAFAQTRDGHPLPEAVAGFSEAAHPQFRLSLLRFEPAGDWIRERVPHSPSASETSNLKFPHDLHLDPSKVESLTTGEALACSRCHALDPDGEHFATLSMETACQDCHSLSFDDDFPRKQLPHGDVESVLLALEEHYIRKHADPELRGGPAERGRRRPGRSRSEETCEGSALDCGRRLALQEATNQFSRSGCVTCHEVGTDASRPFLERWAVQPVRLVDDWYPYAGFDHEVHLTRSRARMDDEVACSSCHAAETSARSEDVLIPGLDNCLQCHGPSGAGEIMAVLSCRGCHDFHLPFRDAMRGHHAGEGSRSGGTVTHLLREGERP
ncbi:cytochrome c3 family protein [Halomonas denitrificans]|nr:hypothetical protein [Halomonas denitrificans]